MKPRCYVSEHAHLEKQLEDTEARAEKAERAAANWRARYEAFRALVRRERESGPTVESPFQKESAGAAASPADILASAIEAWSAEQTRAEKAEALNHADEKRITELIEIQNRLIVQANSREARIAELEAKLSSDGGKA